MVKSIFGTLAVLLCCASLALAGGAVQQNGFNELGTGVSGVSKIVINPLTGAATFASTGQTTIVSNSTITGGVNGGTGGSLILNGSTSGSVTINVPAAPTSYSLTLPSAAPALTGQVLSATTAGVGSFISTEAHISTSGAYGNNTNMPTGSVILAVKAAAAGHFVSLTINTQSLNAGSCTTAPTFNIYDGASNTGTAQIASAAAQGTRGTTTNVAQTQTFAAGDIIGIYVSTAGGTCLAPTFAVDATLAYP